MGNSPKTKEGSEGTENHERLGHIEKGQEQIQGEQGEKRQVMYLSKQVESEKVYQDWLRQFKKVDDTETRDILLLPQKYSFQSVGMCGSSGLAKLKYDYFQFVLETQIQNRFKLKKQFLETQIWYLLYNMIRAGNKFELSKKKIGNVHPNNILINENGQIKIISTCSFPGELDNFQKMIENRNQPVYLAPQEINIDMIEKGQYPTHVDPAKAEVFSIGLTILSSGTLLGCNSIYTQNPLKINRQKLDGLLKIFGEKYSSYLYNTVYSMLAFNPQQRKRSSQIYRSLSQYEDKILQLEPFLPQTNNVRQPLRNSGQFGGYQNVPLNVINNQPMGNYQPRPNVIINGHFKDNRQTAPVYHAYIPQR